MLADQLSWAVLPDVKTIEAELRIQQDVLPVTWQVHDQDSPAVLLGDDIIRWLAGMGWQLETAAWLPPDEVRFEPEVCGEDLHFGGDIHEKNLARVLMEEMDGNEGDHALTPAYFQCEDGTEDDVDVGDGGECMEADSLDMWSELVRTHQEGAVEGTELGGLVGGEEWDADTHVLQEIEALKELTKDIASGPAYTTSDMNPEEFRSRMDKFVPGMVHDTVQVWARDNPVPHSEVLRHLTQGVVVRVPNAAIGIRARNGLLAQQHKRDLAVLVAKRLRNGAWETWDKAKLQNVIGLNLAEKQGADPPWRLITNAIPVNEWVTTYSVKYEGIKKLPLAVTPDCYMVTVDLTSGYDSVLLHPGSRGIFGSRFHADKELLMELQAEGLLVEGCVGTVDAKGGADVFVQPRTLPQGYSRSCSIFTFITRQRVRVWRRLGIRCVHLLDDVLVCAATKEECARQRDFILKDLKEHGFFVNWEKAVLTPSQCVKFLGFVVCSHRMRLFVPGDKIEKIEALVGDLLSTRGSGETFRSLAKVAGKIVSLAMAIPPARIFTREIYKCICPQGVDDWDNKAKVSESMLTEMAWVLKYLRSFNSVGAQIRKAHRMCDVRVMVDASTSGFGYRVQNRERSWKWLGFDSAKACVWDQADSEQVFREMLAVETLVLQQTREFVGKRILICTDAVAVRDYINAGTGRSDVLSTMMKRLWWHCVRHGIGLRAEHVAGTRLVQAAVDGFSRATEFALSWKIWRGLDADIRWGRRWGFSGFSIDACASQKTRKCPRYLSRLGLGVGSVGDLRTALLNPDELHYACPPIGFIEEVLGLLSEAEVPVILVVPNWEGKAWHLWIRERAEEMDLIPWCDWPASWLDVSEKKVKRHEVANCWQFMVVALDFRRLQQRLGEQPLPALPNLRETLITDKQEHLLQLQQKWREEEVLGGKGYRKKKQWPRPYNRRRNTWIRPALKQPCFTILSLCGGIATVARAALQVVRAFNISVQVRVLEVELDPRARAMGTKVSDGLVTHVAPVDMWDWVRTEEGLAELVHKLGTVDAIWLGFSCQDVSGANLRGAGLLGDKSSVAFAGMEIMRVVRRMNKKVHAMWECTHFQRQHPRSWELVTNAVGVTAVTIEAALVAPCYRKRAFWTTFRLLPMTRRDCMPRDFLDAGRRPTWRWKDKLPTIMASGPGSWNMRKCVQDRADQGPLRIGEVERIMGLPTHITAVQQDGVTLATTYRWRGVGNAIHMSVQRHLLVSLLCDVGLIPLKHERLVDQFWTLSLDPRDNFWQNKPRQLGLLELWGGFNPCGNGQQAATSKARRSPRAAGRRIALEVKAARGRCNRKLPRLLNMQDVFRTASVDGLPRLRHISAKMGPVDVEWPTGSGMDSFADELVCDFLALSKSQDTWKSYAAWFGIFEEWCDVYKIDWRRVDLDVCGAVMQRALVLMWSRGGYAAASLELMVTAVKIRFELEGRGNISFSPVVQTLEGILRKMGTAKQKKPPILLEHVCGLMEMAVPQWKGAYARLLWEEAIAVIIVGWQCFCRKQELQHLQTCDLTWQEDACVALIRRTKNDVKGETREATMVFAPVRDEKCMLTRLQEYVSRLYGPAGFGRRRGCTRAAHPGWECPACPFLFPKMTANSLKETEPMSGKQAPGLMKRAIRELELVGKATEGLHKSIACSSSRRGGHTLSSALGIRAAVRQCMARALAF